MKQITGKYGTARRIGRKVAKPGPNLPIIHVSCFISLSFAQSERERERGREAQDTELNT